MSDRISLKRTAIQLVNDCIVIHIEDNADEDYMKQLETDLSRYIRDNRIEDVIIDVSLLMILDKSAFYQLKETAEMIGLLGGRTVFSGFQPGVASALVDLDIDTGDIMTVMTMNDGFEYLRSAGRSDDTHSG